MKTGLKIWTLVFASVAWTAPSIGSSTEVQPFTMDGNVWVAFYDVPSRRFRAIRDSFIRRDFEPATRDLQASIGFLNVEKGRATARLQAPLGEVIERLDHLRSNIRDQQIAVSDLDAVFARSHWLLAQHYLNLSLHFKEERMHRSVGHHLWATAHHLERAVMWSNARLDRNGLDALDSLRRMAVELQNNKRPERAYRDRPVRLAARTLVSIGEQLDREFRIEPKLFE